MAFFSHIKVSRTIVIPDGIQSVRKYIGSVNHMQECMPMVEKITQLEDNSYRIQYIKLGPDGYKIPFSFSASLDIKDENTIAIIPLNLNEDNAVVSGRWELGGNGKQTQATFNTDTQLEIPLSRFLKRIAEPIISKIFTGIINKYIDNVQIKFSNIST